MRHSADAADHDDRRRRRLVRCEEGIDVAKRGFDARVCCGKVALETMVTGSIRRARRRCRAPAISPRCFTAMYMTITGEARGDRLPVDIGGHLAGGIMAGEEDDRVIGVAMGGRKAGIGEAADAGGDARHDAERDARPWPDAGIPRRRGRT